MNLFLRHPITWLRVHRTIYPPLTEIRYAEDLSEKLRTKTRQRIERLARTYAKSHGPMEQHRIAFAEEAIASARECNAVYRFYRRGDSEVQYIGKAKWLRTRLRDHYRECKNPRLRELIESGEAEIEWRLTPFCGWWEDLELYEYKQTRGELPACNQIKGGGCLEKTRRENMDMLYFLIGLAMFGLFGAILGYALFGTVGAIAGGILPPVIGIVALLLLGTILIKRFPE